MTNFVKSCLSAFQTSLYETLPSTCVKRTLQIFGSSKSRLTIKGREYALHRNVHVVAVGKAATDMVRGAEEALGEHFVDGIASIPDGTMRFYTGAKDNLPDENSFKASEKIVGFIKAIRHREDDPIILFLISGGGSALLTAPIQGITLEEKRAVIQALAQRGADIRQLNAVRGALSSLKAGKLAQIGSPAKMIALIVSDIVGDPIHLIASGPTVPCLPNPGVALNVLRALDVVDVVPANVLEVLHAQELEGFISTHINQVQPDVNNLIVASNRLVLETLSHAFLPIALVYVVTTTLEGNASECGVQLAALTKVLVQHLAIGGSECEIYEILAQLAPDFDARQCMANFQNDETPRRIALLFGGETTVRFPTPPPADAKGGRNLELVLAAFKHFNENSKLLKEFAIDFALFSLATDGQDGPTNATGAFVTRADVMHFADSSGEFCRNTLDVCLAGKRSYDFWAFEWLGGQNLVRLGKTCTNFMDVQIIFVEIL